MDKKQLSILIVAGVLIFLIGGGLGIFLIQGSSGRAKVEMANNLSSKVISSIIAYGQVKNINGRNITLSNLGDNLSILIANDAQVYAFVVPTDAGENTTASPVQQTVNFETIKIGDNVNVAVKILPNGQVQGTSVIILPNK
jgi:hypothetical protein